MLLRPALPLQLPLHLLLVTPAIPCSKSRRARDGSSPTRGARGTISRADLFHGPVETIDQGFPMVPPQRTGRAREVAWVSLFLASEEASCVCGAELAVDGGGVAGAWNPTLSGAPGDVQCGSRRGPHQLSARFDEASARSRREQ